MTTCPPGGVQECTKRVQKAKYLRPNIVNRVACPCGVCVRLSGGLELRRVKVGVDVKSMLMLVRGVSVTMVRTYVRTAVPR